MIEVARVGLILTLVSASSLAQSPSPDSVAPARGMAITFDDLPWTSLQSEAPPELSASHARLMDSLAQTGIPLVGFVNESKLERNGELQPQRVQMLSDWLALGADLGNHTYAHVDLHRVGVPAYQQDILRGEVHTRALLAEQGNQPRWFRHPYLRSGQSVAEKQAVEDFLAAHGYRIAPVTIDSSEWIWALAYRRLLSANTQAEQDPTAQRLRAEYVRYMLDKVIYYEQQSVALFQREIPQVLLLHANRLNAHCFAALHAAIEQRGYQFLSLQQVLADPAYQSEDGYFGAYGPSWIHRWAMSAGKSGDFFAGEPRTPSWVLTLAGVDSE